MKIISLNTWHGTKSVELREFLASHADSTDVFCFQEADGVPVEQLFGDVFDVMEFAEITATKNSSSTPDCLKTFVRRGIDVVDSITLLGESGDSAGYSLIVHLRKNDQDIYIANTHGAPYPGDKLDTPGRLEQSRAILEYLNNQIGAKIICGDLNLQPYTESIAMFARAGFVDLIAKYRVATTRNDLAWRKYPTNKQLFADYVFTSREIILNDFSVPQLLISDHLPLLLDYSIETPISAPKRSEYESSRVPATQR